MRGIITYHSHYFGNTSEYCIETKAILPMYECLAWYIEPNDIETKRLQTSLHIELRKIILHKTIKPDVG